MNGITINLNNHDSAIYTGIKWREAGRFLPVSGVVIVTDDNVKQIYGNLFPPFPVFSIEPGEGSKSISTIEHLASKLLDAGIDRSGFILGIGGGVVCDITGFLASVYMRGVKFGFVSTTLLSQVDASVGGKNAVNAAGAKNILGCFRQPEFVICDPEMLKTLPEDEYLSGLPELIKMGLIMDYNLFAKIENNCADILERDTSLLEYLVSVSLGLKASVVMEDEQELTGRRMILNFGHTFGHVIESAARLKHGFAVAAGMIIAAEISVSAGLLRKDDCTRIKALLRKLSLVPSYNLSEKIFETMLLKDKKKQGENINFVLLESLGKAVVMKIRLRDIMDIYKSLSQNNES